MAIRKFMRSVLETRFDGRLSISDFLLKVVIVTIICISMEIPFAFLNAARDINPTLSIWDDIPAILMPFAFLFTFPIFVVVLIFSFMGKLLLIPLQIGYTYLFFKLLWAIYSAIHRRFNDTKQPKIIANILSICFIPYLCLFHYSIIVPSSGIIMPDTVNKLSASYHLILTSPGIILAIFCLLPSKHTKHKRSKNK